MTQDFKGWLLGFIGVAIFATSLPVTRVAVAEFSPIFVGLGRSVVAGIVASIILVGMRAPLPQKREWLFLAFIALGLVFGFPYFSALAMQTVPASHGGVVLGLMPLLTALFAFAFGGERPRWIFWPIALVGAALVVVFALFENANFVLTPGDAYLAVAAIAGGLGYALSGILSKRMPAWAVICWALVISQPLLLLIVLPETISLLSNAAIANASLFAWIAFVWACLMVQLFGFFFFNRGLALGGVARVGQIQLLQIFLTLGFSALLLSETISITTFAFASAVVACILLARRATQPAK